MATDRVFPHSTYNQIIESTVLEIRKLGDLKGGEYAGDRDRLANFRRNGAALDLNMETIWAVYAAKHWDALMQFIQDTEKGKDRVRLEPIGGRVDDLIVYLILLKCMLVERGTPEPTPLPASIVNARTVVMRPVIDDDRTAA